MLKVSHICKTFTGGIIRKTRVNAVKDVSFTIRDGETFGIVGNSGCGKSTIANMLLSPHPMTSVSIGPSPSPTREILAHAGRSRR